MEIQKVEHYQINQKYRIKIERAASTKGVLGYTVEANGDNIAEVLLQIGMLKDHVENMTPVTGQETK